MPCIVHPDLLCLVGLCLPVLLLDILLLLLSPGVDYAAVVGGFIDLLASSRFVAVASIDIILMLIVAATLIHEDCARRGWKERGIALGAASLLLPVLGPCLYLAARPPLAEEFE